MKWLWPDGTSGAKELFFCPQCGEEKPEAEEGESNIWDPDWCRDEEGILVCNSCDEDIRFEPVKVIPVSLVIERLDELGRAIPR